MARTSASMIWWWLWPGAAFAATLVSDALYVATRSLFWWTCSEWSLLVGVASGFLGLLLLGYRAPLRDESAPSRLASAAWVLLIAGLVNAALALGLRAIALPTGALAWLALYLTAMASLLLLAAWAVAWRGRRLRRRLRVALSRDRERVRR